MRIAITGSWREEDAKLWNLRDKPAFFDAVRMLGGSLVQMGHRLVVATDALHTADRAAVDGAELAMTREGVYNEPVVELLRGRRECFTSLASKRPGFISLLGGMPTPVSATHSCTDVPSPRRAPTSTSENCNYRKLA